MARFLRFSFVAVACLLCGCDDNDIFELPVDAGGQQPGVDAGGQQPGVDAGGQQPDVDAGGQQPDGAADAQANRGEGLFAWVEVQRDVLYNPEVVELYNVGSSARLRTFHEGADTPRIERFGDDCFVHSGLWIDAGQSGPSYGKVELTGDGEAGLFFWGELYISEGWPWNEGDVITTIAEGDEMPGFEVSGTVPELPQLTTFDLRYPYTVLDRDRPLTLEWMPQGGEVQVVIEQRLELNAPPILGLRCVFDADAGQGTIPAEAMGELRDEDTPEYFQYPYTEISFDGLNRTTMKVEALDLEYAVSNGTTAYATVE